MEFNFWSALYIFVLTAFLGYELITRVPVILHTPLMSGSNFIHGVVVVGAWVVSTAVPSTEPPVGCVVPDPESVMLPPPLHAAKAVVPRRIRILRIGFPSIQSGKSYPN